MGQTTGHKHLRRSSKRTDSGFQPLLRSCGLAADEPNSFEKWTGMRVARPLLRFGIPACVSQHLCPKIKIGNLRIQFPSAGPLIGFAVSCRTQLPAVSTQPGQSRSRVNQHGCLFRLEAIPVCRRTSRHSCSVCLAGSKEGLPHRANPTDRRLTRLTNAFSKKLENFEAAVALNFAYFNFCKTHQAIRLTPAQPAGVESSAWTVAELLERCGE